MAQPKIEGLDSTTNPTLAAEFFHTTAILKLANKLVGWKILLMNQSTISLTVCCTFSAAF